MQTVDHSRDSTVVPALQLGGKEEKGMEDLGSEMPKGLQVGKQAGLSSRGVWALPPGSVSCF